MTAAPTILRALTPGDVVMLSDDELVAEQAAFAEALRLVNASNAVLAAEVARRSTPELGYSGLAQSRGARTPQKLVQQITGLSAPDARKLVKVGALVTDPSPWMAPVAAGVTSGAISLDAAEAIRSGLGEPGRVAADDLIDAASRLVGEAAELTLERLAARARDARTELDLDSVAEREEERRSRRYLAYAPLPDGNVRFHGIADPESAAILFGAVNARTRPRRGGARFVDEADAPDISGPEDGRTVPQLMLDALVEIVKFASLADPGTVLGARRVGVRLHVAEPDVISGEGYAFIEGQSAVVSIATAERLACDSGFIPVKFDKDARVLNVGKEQRLHTPRMRTGIGARDGGCRVASCDRPPEDCEVHHINEWAKDNGETSVDDGILLCRHHHMLVHNNGWRVIRDKAEYHMIGPTGEVWDMPSKNPILARLRVSAPPG